MFESSWHIVASSCLRNKTGVKSFARASLWPPSCLLAAEDRLVGWSIFCRIRSWSVRILQLSEYITSWSCFIPIVSVRLGLFCSILVPFGTVKSWNAGYYCTDASQRKQLVDANVRLCLTHILLLARTCEKVEDWDKLPLILGTQILAVRKMRTVDSPTN